MRRTTLGALISGGLLLAAAVLVAVWKRGGMGNPAESSRGEAVGSRGKFGGSRADGDGEALPGKSSRRDPSARREKIRNALYSGPNSPDEWIVAGAGGKDEADDQAWEFLDGKLVSRGDGLIAREIEMPPFAKLSFRLESSDSPNLRMRLFSESGDADKPENHYELALQRRFAYMRKRWMTKRSGGSRTVGQPATIARGEENDAVFDLYFDRAAGAVVFYVNGERKAVWLDSSPTQGSFGNWLQFVSKKDHDSAISDLTVSAWNGQLPEGVGIGAATVDVREAEAAAMEVKQRARALVEAAAKWEPKVAYDHEIATIHKELRSAIIREDEATRQAAQQRAKEAMALAHKELEKATAQLPEAKAVAGKPGEAINPFTGKPLTVQGLPPGTPIRDPDDPDPSHVFRVPSGL